MASFTEETSIGASSGVATFQIMVASSEVTYSSSFTTTEASLLVPSLAASSYLVVPFKEPPLLTAMEVRMVT